MDRNRYYLSIGWEGLMVALLAEGVDRNTLIGADGNTYYVALLAEGVDRNCSTPSASGSATGRPPRGGRG